MVVGSSASAVAHGVLHLPKPRLLLGALLVGVAMIAGATSHVEAPRAAPGQLCASPGRDGAGGVLAGAVNTDYPGTASVAAGATAIPVGAPTGAATPVAAGDLVLVIQMQGADVDSSDSDAYGDGQAGGTASGALTGTTVAGRYEYAVATGPVTAGSLPVVGKGPGNGLVNSYLETAATAASGARTFQVVRVPQYATATAGPGLTAPAWDGATGGVLALDVTGVLTLAGTVSVSELGFRGGGDRQLGGSSGLPAGTYRSSAASPTNGSKGEGTAGTPTWVQQGGGAVDTGIEGYPNGSEARGAPGTAGGGGTDGNEPANDQNTGGGGGGNGGAGGRGGDAWFSSLPYGGEGGAAFSASSPALVAGGGGGAGTRNNAGPSGGAAGGGLLLARAGAVAGSGTITADGGAGQPAANDGGGGGGAGGSVLIDAATGTLAGVTVTANGGAGGTAWATQPPAGTPGERHGPGGGGGGGVVLASTTPAATSVAGGPNGTSTTAADPYGATAGTDGVVATLDPSTVPGADAGARCTPALTVTKSTSTPSVAKSTSGTTATYTIRLANEVSRAPATDAVLGDVLPTGLSYLSTTTVGLTGGATRDATVDPSPGAATPSWGSFSIPGGGAVAVTFVARVSPSVPTGTVQNPATATYADLASPGGTATASYDPAASTSEDVTVSLSAPAAAPPPPPKPGTGTAPSPPAAPTADLGVRIDGAAVAAAGEVVPLVVTVANAGPDVSPGTTLSITLPPGATLSDSIELSGGPANAVCTTAGSSPRCALGLVPSGGEIAVRLDVRLGPPTAGGWTARASVAGDAPDPVPPNNAASHPIRPLGKARPTVKPPAGRGRAKLVLAKVALTPRVRPGDPVRFRITVRNTGTRAARNLTVCDLPPRTATLVSAPGSTLAAGRACWRVPRLEAGEKRSFAVRLRLDAAAPPGVLRNVAILRGARRAVAPFVVHGKPRPGRGGGVTG